MRRVVEEDSSPLYKAKFVLQKAARLLIFTFMLIAITQQQTFLPPS